MGITKYFGVSLFHLKKKCAKILTLIVSRDFNSIGRRTQISGLIDVVFFNLLSKGSLPEDIIKSKVEVKRFESTRRQLSYF